MLNSRKEGPMKKIQSIILAALCTTFIVACQEDSDSSSKDSSEVADQLGLVGSWLSPCMPFDGASIKKVHKFSGNGSLDVSVVEFKDKKCAEQGKQINIGTYNYSLTERDSNIANIDVEYPYHKELGVVKTKNDQMHLAYGTDYQETRDSMKLKDLETLKAWKKIK